MTKSESALALNARELATILAALRYWQTRQPQFDRLDSIATDGGIMQQLTDTEIDGLCDRLNREPASDLVRPALTRLLGAIEADVEFCPQMTVKIAFETNGQAIAQAKQALTNQS